MVKIDFKQLIRVGEGTIFKAPSTSRPGLFHFQIWQANSQGIICTCEGFQHQGHCWHQEKLQAELKYCHKCSRLHPRDNFYKGNNNDGLQSQCMDCQRSAGRKWREHNVDYLREYHATRYQEKVETFTEYSRQRRARLEAAFVEPVDLDVLYVESAGKCGICLESLERYQATVDHIIPLCRGGEHSMANCQVAHGPCNSRKGTKTMEEYRRHYGEGSDAKAVSQAAGSTEQGVPPDQEQTTGGS